MDPPVQIGQYVLGKNLGIGAFGKVSYEKAVISTGRRTHGVKLPVNLVGTAVRVRVLSLYPHAWRAAWRL